MSDGNWWKGAVIYQIYPRSFFDSNGDGIGDLCGITDKLEYISFLGVDAIWISPFFKSPMKDFGYDVSDYCDVDPIFGTIDDFKGLVQKAHSLGLKVIIDQVWSHTSDEHPWFIESASSTNNEKSDWYVWADPKPDGTPPNNWLPYFGGGSSWTWSSERKQYYFHQFLIEQPTLNLWNQEVRGAILNSASFWFGMGVDGFRVDATHTFLYDRDLKDNPPRPKGDLVSVDISSDNPQSYQMRLNSGQQPESIQLIEEIRSFVNRYDDRCLLGEVGGEDGMQLMADYSDVNTRFHFSYSFDLLASSLDKKSVESIIRAFEKVQDEDDWWCWSSGNHDVTRVGSRQQHKDLSKKDFALYAMALGLSLRGSFCMYQGEELGLEDVDVAYEDLQDPLGKMFYPKIKGRDGCRTPIPWVKDSLNAGFTTGENTWLPIPDSHRKKSVDQQENDKSSVLNHYRRFLAWRKNKSAMKVGDFTFIETNNHIIAFSRHDDEGCFECYFNSGNVSESVSLDSGRIIDEVSRKAVLSENSLKLDPYGYAFIEK